MSYNKRTHTNGQFSLSAAVFISCASACVCVEVSFHSLRLACSFAYFLQNNVLRIVRSAPACDIIVKQCKCSTLSGVKHTFIDGSWFILMLFNCQHTAKNYWAMSSEINLFCEREKGQNSLKWMNLNQKYIDVELTGLIFFFVFSALLGQFVFVFKVRSIVDVISIIAPLFLFNLLCA